MAIGFDGSTAIYSTDMNGYFVQDHKYSCGVISYWFNTSLNFANQETGNVIMQIARIPFLSTGTGASHIIRIEHGTFGSSQYSVVVQLQFPFFLNGVFNPDYWSIVAFGEDILPLYDNKWHHVLISWNVAVDPVIVVIRIDDHLHSVTYFNSSPNAMSPGAIVLNSTAAKTEFIRWHIGAEGPQIGNQNPSDYYTGFLDKLILYVSDNDYTNDTSEVHCQAIAYFKKKNNQPDGEHPATVQMIPDGYYVFCQSVPDTQNQSLLNPTFPQLSLGGNAARFPINYGNRILPNPFGLSTKFLVRGTGLLDAPTTP